MASIVVSGDTSGSVTLSAPAAAGSSVLTLPAVTDTLVGLAATQILTNKTLTSPTITGASMSSMASSVITSGTANTSLSGTVIDFTGIPSWVKRVTVMFNGVSTSGTSYIQIQLITSVAVTSGYNSVCTSTAATGLATQAITSGFNLVVPAAGTDLVSGSVSISNLTGNTWCYQSVMSAQAANRSNIGGGGIALAAALTGIRITTINGTDTFDAGSINILYE